MKHRTFFRPLLFTLTLALLPACSKPVTLKAVQATPTHVEFTVSTTTAGTVEAQQQAVLVFGTVGRVEAIAIQSGAVVKKGQLLAKQENRDFQSIHENAAKELDRAKKLFKSNLVSRSNLDEATRAFEVARANFDKTEIRAPFDGVVTEVNLQVGETSQPQAPVDKPPMRIVDQKPRIIKGSIDEVDLSKVHVGDKARIKVLAVRPKPFDAVVDRVVPFVSTTKEQERTAKVELKITEGDELIPVGASAEIEIIVEDREKTLAVPSRAVLGAGTQRYVYRVENERLKKTSITPGIGNYDRTEVASGLSSGDTVVLPGDTELKDGMKIKTERITWP